MLLRVRRYPEVIMDKMGKDLLKGSPKQGATK